MHITPSKPSSSFSILFWNLSGADFKRREVAENNICQRESETCSGVESFLLAFPAKNRNLRQCS